MSQVLLKKKALDIIDSAETRQALEYLDDLFADNTNLRGTFKEGVFMDYQIRNMRTGNQDLSFIVNKGHLLFYFRSWAVQSGRYRLDLLKTIFNGPENKPIKKDKEWIVKIIDLDDAEKLAGFLKLT